MQKGCRIQLFWLACFFQPPHADREENRANWPAHSSWWCKVMSKNPREGTFVPATEQCHLSNGHSACSLGWGRESGGVKWNSWVEIQLFDKIKKRIIIILIYI